MEVPAVPRDLGEPRTAEPDTSPHTGSIHRAASAGLSVWTNESVN